MNENDFDGWSPDLINLADVADNSGDGSAIFDANSGDSNAPTSTVTTPTGTATVVNVPTSATAPAAQSNSAWSGFFGTTLPGIFTTAAGSAAQAAAGQLATQTKTAATPNAVTVNPVPGTKKTTATVYVVGGLIVAAIIGGIVWVSRRGKAKK